LYRATNDVRFSVQDWIDKWMVAALEGGIDSAEAIAAMKQASPKYVVREWMLVKAYKAAERTITSLCARCTSFSRRRTTSTQSMNRSLFYNLGPEPSSIT